MRREWEEKPGFSKKPGFGNGRLMPAGRDRAVERLRLAELRPEEAVKGNESEADHRHDETAGHIVLVGDVAHQLGQDRRRP